MTEVRAARPDLCAHCGLPLADAQGRPGRARVATSAPGDAGDAGEPSTCCIGCALAWRLSGSSLEGAPDKLLARVVLCAFLAMGVMVFSLSLYGALLDPARAQASEAARALTGVFRMGALACATPAMLLLGVPLLQAVVSARRWLSAEALILAGSSAAYGLSVWNTLRGSGEVFFDTATMVLVLTGLGRWLDVRTRERARGDLAGLAREIDAKVCRVTPLGDVETEFTDLARGDLVRVRPGEVIPVDGWVESGRSYVDAAALTGESEPACAEAGSRVLAGGRLVDGTLVVVAEAVDGERVRDGIDRLLAEALRSRPRAVRLADRVAGALMPLVLALAAATAVFHWRSSGPEKALLAALSVVLISCPCALGVATPLAFWTATGAAWRRGVLVRGGEVLERLARTRRVLLDKTGTLTEPVPELVRIEPVAGQDPARLLEWAAALEQGSEHPLGRSVRRAFGARRANGAELRALAVEGFRRLPGTGVEGVVEGRPMRLRAAPHPSAPPQASAADGTRVVLEDGEGRALGHLVFRARLVEGAREALERLRARHLEARILTGDAARPARELAAQVGLEFTAECSPLDKVEAVRAAGPGTLFVGDGLNDTAALALAEVGVAVAGGSAASMQAAPVNLLRPGLSGLVDTLDLARRAVGVARFNLAWAFLYNAVGLALAVSGELPPIFAASAMVVSSLVVVVNSGRLRAAAAPDRIQPGAAGRREESGRDAFAVAHESP